MLRIACDLDGTIADLSSAYRKVEGRLQSDSDGVVWDAIRGIPDFWTTLEPLEPGVIRRLFELSQAGQWEVFFVTQRPITAGETVQRQTQRWLMAHGFETPSVLTVPGSRGRAALALDLDFLIDDLPRNCVDVVSDSRCRPLLVSRGQDPEAEETAARFKISVVRSVSEALDLLTASAATPVSDSFSHRMLKRLGLG
jgi:hypothetical protein